MITVKKRKLQSGLISLCSHNKKTGEIKALNMYLQNGTDKITKAINKELMQAAESIIKELNLIEAKKLNGTYIAPPEEKKIYDFIQEISRDCSESRMKLYITLRNHLNKFDSGLIYLSQIDKLVINGFNSYLSRKIKAQNSRATYLETFRSLLKEGFKKGLFAQDLSVFVDGIKTENNQREFLTASEIERLKNTDCLEVVKKISLASLVTGLRFVDLINLRSSNFHFDENGGYWYIKMEQKKTGKEIILPISDSVFEFFEVDLDNDVSLFNTDYNRVTYNLNKWFMAAGVPYKKAHFHVFRHTFANIQLNAGTDIFTLSGLMGHSSVTTTQFYATPLLEKKVEAMTNINI